MIATTPAQLQFGHTATSVRIDLQADPTFPAVWGRRVKEVGGNYNACRGSSVVRFVSLPVTQEGLALAEEIMADERVYPHATDRGQLRHRIFTVVFTSSLRNCGGVIYAPTMLAACAQLARTLEMRVAKGAEEDRTPRPPTEAEHAESLRWAEERVTNAKKALADAEEALAKLKGADRLKLVHSRAG